MIEYKLEKSLRRTLSLQIKPDATIIVKAPIFLPQHEIEKFIEQKTSWIEKHLQKISKRGIRAVATKHSFETGDKFLYLGTEYPLSFSDEYKQKLQFNGAFIIPQEIAKKGKKAIKNLVITWYKNKARDLFNQRLMIYSSNHDLSFEEMRLTSAKTRWGSCTSQNNIRLNWKLIMAPIEILDYVVVHELSHTIHHNHSKAFWNLVESIIPDWKDKRKWLRENGTTLVV
jgi:predicted metal-dependent hydrolase